jgi:hypothetical protein
MCFLLQTAYSFDGANKFLYVKGYIEGNVAWISNRANSVKGDSSIKDILSLAEWLSSLL